jgi:hypothetical protein
LLAWNLASWILECERGSGQKEGGQKESKIELAEWGPQIALKKVIGNSHLIKYKTRSCQLERPWCAKTKLWQRYLDID